MNDTWITISGWVGSVHTRTLPDGQQVTTLRVGSTPRHLREGEWRDGVTAWHTVKAWRALAGHVAESVHTGEPVLVHGRVVAEEWTRPDGSPGGEHVLVASSIGHDLSRGRARFTRDRSPGQPGGGDRDPRPDRAGDEPRDQDGDHGSDQPGDQPGDQQREDPAA